MDVLGAVAFGPFRARPSPEHLEGGLQPLRIPSGVMKFVSMDHLTRTHEKGADPRGLAVAEILQTVRHCHAAWYQTDHRQKHQPAAFGVNREAAKLGRERAALQLLFEQLGKTSAEVHGRSSGWQVGVGERTEKGDLSPRGTQLVQVVLVIKAEGLIAGDGDADPRRLSRTIDGYGGRRRLPAELQEGVEVDGLFEMPDEARGQFIDARLFVSGNQPQMSFGKLQLLVFREISEGLCAAMCCDRRPQQPIVLVPATRFRMTPAIGARRSRLSKPRTTAATDPAIPRASTTRIIGDSRSRAMAAVLPGPSNKPMTPSTIEMSAASDAIRLMVDLESIHRSRFRDGMPVTAVCQIGSI